ncbi:hypothetical protein PaG_01148 [Moesziomyces aphidis]|uniref:Uncharacterized protein n=1 Tax=Moesziomyces aphidis TaxID=84754 RepID=W3VS38_MOEAP|nr:hypothetical protein PaG_01148 [Moesziomyces aphidis]
MMNPTLASRAFVPSRSLSTSSVRLLRPRTSTPTSASQPVLQKNAPPPPTRRSPVQSPPPQPRPGKRGGKEGSVYASYRALPYNTKLVFWTCGAMFAGLGLLAADKLEQLFPARNNRPTESKPDAQPKLIDHKPRLLAISVVDRDPNRS